MAPTPPATPWHTHVCCCFGDSLLVSISDYCVRKQTWSMRQIVSDTCFISLWRRNCIKYCSLSRCTFQSMAVPAFRPTVVYVHKIVAKYCCRVVCIDGVSHRDVTPGCVNEFRCLQQLTNDGMHLLSQLFVVTSFVVVTRCCVFTCL